MWITLEERHSRLTSGLETRANKCTHWTALTCKHENTDRHRRKETCIQVKAWEHTHIHTKEIAIPTHVVIPNPSSPKLWAMDPCNSFKALLTYLAFLWYKTQAMSRVHLFFQCKVKRQLISPPLNTTLLFFFQFLSIFKILEPASCYRYY